MSPELGVVARVLDAGACRLALAFLISLALWAAALLGLEHAMRPTAHVAPAPQALAMQLVEIAPPTESTHAAAIAPEPQASPPSAAPEEHTEAAPLHDAPASRPEPAPRRAPPMPAKPSATPRSARPRPAAAAAPSAAAPSAVSPTATPEDRGIARDSPARALAQPLPTLPDDLRERNLRAVALARFLIRADGSVQVTLIKPTPNPRLNLLLLEALKKWRFAPAMKDGKAAQSSQDIRVHFNVD